MEPKQGPTEQQPEDQQVSIADFPRSARLLTPAAYAAVFEQRKARRGRFFQLHFGPLSTQQVTESPSGNPQARIGIAVPKKLLKRAVDRNLIKRLARETFRTMRARLEIRDYILRLSSKPKAEGEAIDRVEVMADIVALLNSKLANRPTHDHHALLSEPEKQAKP